MPARLSVWSEISKPDEHLEIGWENGLPMDSNVDKTVAKDTERQNAVDIVRPDQVHSSCLSSFPVQYGCECHVCN